MLNDVESCDLLIVDLVGLLKVLEHKRFSDEFILVSSIISIRSFSLSLSAQLEIEKNYFATSLSVLEDQPMDMLLGLDMLRRHQVILPHLDNLHSKKNLRLRV